MTKRPDFEIQPRSREVWLRDDLKTINRAVRLFLSKGIAIDMHCTNAACFDTKLTREPNASGFDLLCGCKRRVINFQ